jgi:hypothetical protein
MHTTEYICALFGPLLFRHSLFNDISTLSRRKSDSGLASIGGYASELALTVLYSYSRLLHRFQLVSIRVLFQCVHPLEYAVQSRQELNACPVTRNYARE